MVVAVGMLTTLHAQAQLAAVLTAIQVTHGRSAHRHPYCALFSIVKVEINLHPASQYVSAIARSKRCRTFGCQARRDDYAMLMGPDEVRFRGPAL